MNLDTFILELSVIIVGAAALGTLFLYAKQPIVIAYIAIGIAVGPNGFALIDRTDHIEEISQFGVMLLLFILGLNLRPTKLIKLFQKTSLLTLGTALLFFAVSFLCALALGFDKTSALLLGAAMMFSSTVVSLKLIPTTTLHHKRTGELMTSVLLLQDMLAIVVISFIAGDKSDSIFTTLAMLSGKLGLLCLLSFVGVRFVMVPLLNRFDVVQEYTFVATLAWCLLWAESAEMLGLSYEMGAFIAGLSIASSTISLVISERLKPLREFFLILFFFTVGSRLNLDIEPKLLLAAVAFGVFLVLFKAFAFRVAFALSGEPTGLCRELAVRLGQSSEFSLLVAAAALSIEALSDQEVMIIQITTIVTFIISTYWVVLKYPTPISGKASLRQD